MKSGSYTSSNPWVNAPISHEWLVIDAALSSTFGSNAVNRASSGAESGGHARVASEVDMSILVSGTSLLLKACGNDLTVARWSKENSTVYLIMLANFNSDVENEEQDLSVSSAL